MAKLSLSFACALYDRMQPLYTGEVTPDGIELNFIAIDEPRPIFDRMSGGQEFDVDLSKIHWVQGAMNTPNAHGNPTVLPLLKPVPIEHNRSGKSMSDLIEERVVDATLGTSLPDAIRRNPDIVRLFPDYEQLEKEYYKRTRIFPIMHLVAIRKDVYERHPFVASSLYDAMCKAKDIALTKM